MLVAIHTNRGYPVYVEVTGTTDETVAMATAYSLVYYGDVNPNLHSEVPLQEYAEIIAPKLTVAAVVDRYEPDPDAD